MKEQFVTYEIAKRMKELGFNEPCFTVFVSSRVITFLPSSMNYCKNNNELPIHTVSAPLWQQAIDWLREKYNVEIWVEPAMLSYRYKILASDNKWEGHKEIKFEQARETAILKALEIIDKK